MKGCRVSDKLAISDAGTVITGDVTIGHHSLIRCNVTIRGGNQIGYFLTHIYDNVCIDGGRPAQTASSPPSGLVTKRTGRRKTP